MPNECAESLNLAYRIVGNFAGQTERRCQSASDPRASHGVSRILRAFRSRREGCASQWTAFPTRRWKLRPHWLGIKFDFSILLSRSGSVKILHDAVSRSLPCLSSRTPSAPLRIRTMFRLSLPCFSCWMPSLSQIATRATAESCQHRNAEAKIPGSSKNAT